MPASPSAPPAAAVPPVGLGELFEQSMHALVRAPEAFRAAAARPAPGYVTALTLALADGALAIAINLVHSAISNPRFLDRYSGGLLAAISAAVLGVYLSLFLLLAVVLYALGLALGGKGEFNRGVQAAAALTLLAPLQSAANALPHAWPLPALLAGWMAAGALTGLFSASLPAARALCGVMTAAMIGGQFFLRAVASRASDLAAAASVAAQAAQINAQFARGFPMTPPSSAGFPAAVDAPAAPGSAPAPRAVSGLDLLRAPDDGDAALAAPRTPAQVASDAAALNTQAQGVEQSAVAMLDAFAPMLNNPALTQRMNAQQQYQFRQLNGMIKNLRAQIASGRAVPPAEMNRQMLQIQQLAMGLMMTQAAAPPPTPHLKPMGNP
ncbi:MAG: hypothetical protein HKL90_15790 [Elusimicrobia bacterium]|nr:hypothetical protein [Elusimicrobiota bacterium]